MARGDLFTLPPGYAASAPAPIAFTAVRLQLSPASSSPYYAITKPLGRTYSCRARRRGSIFNVRVWCKPSISGHASVLVLSPRMQTGARHRTRVGQALSSRGSRVPPLHRRPGDSRSSTTIPTFATTPSGICAGSGQQGLRSWSRISPGRQRHLVRLSVPS